MKRVIAVSDSHGDLDSLRDAFVLAKRSGPIDAAVFLGDGASEFEIVRRELEMQGICCYSVAGNNDWRYMAVEPQELVFTIGNVCFYACHGHTRGVKYGLERLWYAARERGAQVALYGHTHCADIALEYGRHLINPGAICSRRPNGPAFAEIRVEDNGAVIPQIVRWEK